MCRMRYLVFTVVVGWGAWQSSLVSAQQVQLNKRMQKKREGHMKLRRISSFMDI